jgi:hypothetical protein
MPKNILTKKQQPHMKNPVHIIENKCLSRNQSSSTMSGAYGGVRSFTKNEQTFVVYVHCAAHNLNLIFNDAVSAVGPREWRDAQAFFTTMQQQQQLFAFFGRSIGILDLLSSVTGESSVTLKKLNPILARLSGGYHSWRCNIDILWCSGNESADSRCVGEHKMLLSVVMHWSSRNSCSHLSLCRFSSCWQKFCRRSMLNQPTYLQSKDADLLNATLPTHLLKTAFGGWHVDWLSVKSRDSWICIEGPKPG